MNRSVPERCEQANTHLAKTPWPRTTLSPSLTRGLGQMGFKDQAHCSGPLEQMGARNVSRTFRNLYVMSQFLSVPVPYWQRFGF